MVEKVFYQSSLPRCGSTLLQNILAQNPDIYATPTSGVCDLLLNLKHNYTNGIEFKAQDSNIMDNGFRSMCKGAMYGFYNGITGRKYVIDKCRGWSITYDFVNWFDPDPKVIIMIRDLRSIVSSLEKKFRENQHLDSGLQNWNEMKGTTVDKRVDMFLSIAPPLCAPIDIIYDVIVRRIAQKCLFVKFEDLCANPDREILKVYNYLNIPCYGHDYNNVEQFTKENDVFYRPFGDHHIRGKINPLEEDYLSVLGIHNCKYITEKYSWYYKAFNYNV